MHPNCFRNSIGMAMRAGPSRIWPAPHSICGLIFVAHPYKGWLMGLQANPHKKYLKK